MRQRFKRGQTILQIDGAGHCGTITWRATADPKRVAVCYCSDYQTFDWVNADKTINCPREFKFGVAQRLSGYLLWVM